MIVNFLRQKKVNDFLQEIIWIYLASPDGNSKRTLCVKWPRLSFRSRFCYPLKLFSWKNGQMRWLENLLAKILIFPGW